MRQQTPTAAADITLTGSRDVPSASGSTVWRVHLLHAPAEVAQLSRSWELPPGTSLAIGRSATDANIAIRDPRMSRVHARLALGSAGAQPTLSDCASRNGTEIGGAPVSQAHVEVPDGALLRLGDSFLLLRRWPARIEDADVSGLLGVSPAMCALRARLVQLAPQATSVLVRGETGTGKELVSAALHRLSYRTGALVAVNCGAIPAELAESQLFGHAAGAFTGARAHAGFFRSADHGTLLLDEVGELVAHLQPKLLRALETRTITPLGTSEPVACDVRVVAATNRNLELALASGVFRRDLYARLAQAVLQIAPLRERREDVLPLLQFAGVEIATLPPHAIEQLLLHRWPLNVRELLRVADHLRQHTLDEGLRLGLEAAGPEPAPTTGTARGRPAPLGRAEPTREQLEGALQRHRGMVLALSRELGWSRRQIGRFLAAHQLDPRRFRERG